MKIDDLNEGPLNFIKGVVGAVAARSHDPKTKQWGKQARAAAALNAENSSAGKKRKLEKVIKVMTDKWKDHVAKQGGISDNEWSSAGKAMYFEWLFKFLNVGKNPNRKELIKKDFPGKMRDVPAHIKSITTELMNTPSENSPIPAQPITATPSAETPIATDTATPSATGTATLSGKFKRTHNDSTRNKPTESIEKSFNRYLAEAGAGKNTHMEHLEDLVFNNGYEGAEQAIEYIMQVAGMLSDGTGEKATITTKWDGAPAIICGIDPADGKFFVGTKSVFNTEPRLAKNKASLMKYYGDKDGLWQTLELALNVLPELGIGGVLQGDFMFDRKSLVTETINGENMLSFTPNTITYAMPADSDLAKRMLRAKMGIVFHTAYEGAELSTMQARFGVDVSGLNQSKEVWVDDATFRDVTGKATLTTAELSKIGNQIKAIQATMQKIRPAKFNIVIDNKEFSKYIKPFVNQMVRDGKGVTSTNEFLTSFLTFYKGKLQVEIDKIIVDKGEENVGVQNRIIKMQQKEEFLEDNSNAILGVLAVYKRIVEIKLMIIQKLHQVAGLRTFVRDGDGYKVTNPEGFVAIRQDGGAIKLVDRLEFSQQNFNAVKAWKK
jgi:hypothetical protein